MSASLSPDARVELEAARREFILKSVTKDDWEVIVLKAVDQAKHGNSAARQWLSDYVAPVPMITTELSLTPTGHGDALLSLAESFPGLAATVQALEGLETVTG